MGAEQRRELIMQMKAGCGGSLHRYEGPTSISSVPQLTRFRSAGTILRFGWHGTSPNTAPNNAPNINYRGLNNPEIYISAHLRLYVQIICATNI